LTFSAETLGIRISFRAHQWMVDFGTPDSAAARSAVYAPVRSIAVKIPRRAVAISFLGLVAATLGPLRACLKS
jgi:hypothetical protein